MRCLVGKALVMQARGLEFVSQNPHKGRRKEFSPQRCPKVRLSNTITRSNVQQHKEMCRVAEMDFCLDGGVVRVGMCTSLRSLSYTLELVHFAIHRL